MMDRVVTCTAPVNIAVIKYWGKRDESLILPLNDSISFTLSQDELNAKTTVMLSSRFVRDRFWLNNKEESVENPRILNCLNEIRRRAGKRKQDNEDKAYIQWHAHINSVNNFPTSAGLASSAAGYACLVFALSKVFEVEGNLSSVARLGSGSACRSMFGGMAQWFKGQLEDGSDSLAQQIASPFHWGDLHVIICIVFRCGEKPGVEEKAQKLNVQLHKNFLKSHLYTLELPQANDGKKKVSSTEGMKRSFATSFFMKCRLQDSIEKRIEALLKAVESKDWSAFCDLTITDSNEMHATCLDSFPPCIYMNDTSHAVAALIHQYNNLKSELNKVSEKVCYTFDAGPNGCIFVPETVVSEFISVLNECFHKQTSYNHPDAEYWQGIQYHITQPPEIFAELVNDNRQQRHSIKYFILTRIGDGPRVLNDDDDGSPHLLDQSSGLPNSNHNPNISRCSVIHKGHRKNKTSENEPSQVP